MKTSRRDFIKKLALLSTGLLVSGCDTYGRGRGADRRVPILVTNPAIRFHQNRCRGRCDRCLDYCRNATGGIFDRNLPSGEEACVHCGQCTLFCPRGALTERFHYQEVARAIADPQKIVVVTTAPAIRVAFGEMYGMVPGTNVEGEIVGALRQLGVDYVFDATFCADLTVVEEASELIQQLEIGKLPLFTSCCPAWVRYIKLFYPNYYSHISTVKSPLLMQGALIKTWFAQRKGIDPSRIVCVAIAPSTAKKAEILLPGMNSAGVLHGNPQMRDVDFVITTRELASLFNENGVNFRQAPRGQYDSLMGTGSSSAMIFGNSGGVMTASLRTAYRMLNNERPPADFVSFHPVSGFGGVRTAVVDMGKTKLNVAIIHGISNIRSFMERDAKNYDFVEVMACPGGCIGGGGQPIVAVADSVKVRQLRLNALYRRDAEQTIRLSYDNPEVKTIYDEFLEKPLGENSKKLLHCTQ